MIGMRFPEFSDKTVQYLIDMYLSNAKSQVLRSNTLATIIYGLVKRVIPQMFLPRNYERNLKPTTLFSIADEAVNAINKTECTCTRDFDIFFRYAYTYRHGLLPLCLSL